MITRVQVKNFRSIADIDVTLGPLTVLVGCNGAGKSAFLDVLRFVRDAVYFSLDAAIVQRHGITVLRRWSSRGRPHDVEITVTVRKPNLWGEYSFVIGSGQQGKYRVKREVCSIGKDVSSAKREFEIRDGQWLLAPSLRVMSQQGEQSLLSSQNDRLSIPMDPTELVMTSASIYSDGLDRIHDSLADNKFYALFPNTLREPKRPLNDYSLEETGENLTSVVRRLKKENDLFPDLLAALSRVVEDVSDVRVRQVGGYLVTELKHGRQNGRSPWFDLAQESDGTLRMLGLLVALYQNTSKNLIAIEEPELTIHPGALGVLSDVMREVAQRSQILITTQSPDLISRFGAEELRVVERVNGQTQIGPVDEMQREAINEQLFSAGDLLRIEGLRRAPLAVAGEGDA